MTRIPSLPSEYAPGYVTYRCHVFYFTSRYLGYENVSQKVVSNYMCNICMRIIFLEICKIRAQLVIVALQFRSSAGWFPALATMLAFNFVSPACTRSSCSSRPICRIKYLRRKIAVVLLSLKTNTYTHTYCMIAFYSTYIFAT